LSCFVFLNDMILIELNLLIFSPIVIITVGVVLTASEYITNGRFLSKKPQNCKFWKNYTKIYQFLVINAIGIVPFEHLKSHFKPNFDIFGSQNGSFLTKNWSFWRKTWKNDQFLIKNESFKYFETRGHIGTIFGSKIGKNDYFSAKMGLHI